MMDKIMQALRDKHGEDLTFKDGEAYFIFFKDGLYSIYLEEDTSTLKVEVEFLTEGKTYVYSSDDSLENLLS